MHHAPGDWVTPNLRLVAPLGHGGMGSVWVGEHVGLGAEVAVKFIAGRNRGSGDGGPAARRFRREASLAAKIGSPHAVRIFDHAVMADGQPFIVMERLHGETLAARIARDGRMPLDTVVTLVAQIAGALGAAHALGIVHRDVKPDNIFLCDSDAGLFVKLLDFGLAKQIEPEIGAVTVSGSVLGTPHYMSPEQLLGAQRLGPACDRWALGVVAYEALTGERPFAGATVAALSLAVFHSTPASPCERLPELPRALDSWFGRALSIDTAGRFESARDQARALAAAARGEALPPAPPPRTGLADRSPAVATRTDSGELTAQTFGEPAESRPRGRGLAWATVIAVLVGALLLEAIPGGTFVPGALQAAVGETRRERPAPRAAEAQAPPPATQLPAANPPRRLPRASRPAYCAGDGAYRQNELGHLVARAECL